jgi:chemotaxis response regulator CheB
LEVNGLYTTAAKSTGLPRKRVKVIIVSELGTLRARLRLRLDSQPWVIVKGETRTHLEALAVAASERPEVILVDAAMDEGRALDHITELLRVADHILVVAGAYDSPEPVLLTSIGTKDVVIEAMVCDAINEIYGHRYRADC